MATLEQRITALAQAVGADIKTLFGRVLAGTASPEGSVTATPGKLYERDNGLVYRKATGTGNTGWVELATGGVQVLTPVGLYAANLTTVTGLVANASIYQYLGKAQGTPTLAEVVYRVATAAAGAATYAEVAIFRGAPVAGAAGPLTRLGFTDIAAVVTTAGIKKANVTLAGVVPGDDLWVAFGGQFATTQFQLRGLLADDIQTGNCRYATGTRPSTLAAGGTPALAAATVVPVWCSVRV